MLGLAGRSTSCKRTGIHAWRGIRLGLAGGNRLRGGRSTEVCKADLPSLDERSDTLQRVPDEP